MDAYADFTRSLRIEKQNITVKINLTLIFFFPIDFVSGYAG